MQEVEDDDHDYEEGGLKVADVLPNLNYSQNDKWVNTLS
jgi:hypothetical protein